MEVETDAWPTAPATGAGRRVAEGGGVMCVLWGESEKSAEEAKFLFLKTI